MAVIRYKQNGEWLVIPAISQEEKETLQELQPVTDELLTSVNTGVSGIIEADSLEFNVTADMVGKRIICYANTGKKINLPSPSAVGRGAMIEITVNTATKITEIYTPSGVIYKGKRTSYSKCIQPSLSTRRYISDGTNWVTNFGKTPSSEVDCIVYINPVHGSDTEPIYNGDTRVFASFSQIELLEEYHRLRIAIASDTVLDKSIIMNDVDLMIWGGNDRVFTIPADYDIRLSNCNLDLHWLNLKIEGIAFILTGVVNVTLGGYEGLFIRPLANADFTLFRFCVGGRSYSYGYNAMVAITFDSVRFKTDNLEEFTAKGNIIVDTKTFQRSSIFIQQGDGPFEKPDTVKWHNDSDTLSRIGTSSMYVLG